MTCFYVGSAYGVKMANPASPQYETARDLTRLWCEGALRQAAAYREVLADVTDEAKWRRYGENILSDNDFRYTVDALWAEGHLLIVAFNQAEIWATKMADENSEQRPARTALLRDVRNVLEHLSEAELSTDRATANPSKPQSVNTYNALPNKELLLSVVHGKRGLMVFEKVDLAQLEEQCMELINLIENQLT